ncbi:MAG: hypothetical protein AAF244_03565 [Pseudomonadota bacterium]
MKRLASIFAVSACLIPSSSDAATIQYGELTRDDYCQILESQMRNAEDEATYEKTIIEHVNLCAHRLLLS